MPKRYLVTKTLTTRIPWWDFIHAKGKRSISLVSCDFIEKVTEGSTVVVRTPTHITMHSSIVQTDKFCDSFVDFVNRVRDKRPKYEQLIPEDFITVWFKNIDDIAIDYNTTEFVVKFLLEWEIE